MNTCGPATKHATSSFDLPQKGELRLRAFLIPSVVVTSRSCNVLNLLILDQAPLRHAEVVAATEAGLTFNRLRLIVPPLPDDQIVHHAGRHIRGQRSNASMAEATMKLNGRLSGNAYGDRCQWRPSWRPLPSKRASARFACRVPALQFGAPGVEGQNQGRPPHF